MRKYIISVTLTTMLLGLIIIGLQSIDASSHREAPIISNDPLADNTDVYAFVSPDDQTTVTLVACYIPFVEPVGGPNFNRFGDNVLYTINIDNDHDAKRDIWYNFEFTTTVGNGNTFLYNVNQVTSLDDPDLNVKQTYTITRGEEGGTTTVFDNSGSGYPVPPPNISETGNSPLGPSTPNYVGNLMTPAIQDISGLGKIFAGPTDDPFFVDLGVFDLLAIRPGAPGASGGGKDGLGGFNVYSIAMQLPKTDAVASGDSIIGVWATASRRSMTVIDSTGARTASGDWVQVSRLGMPLVNEVVAPIAAKDLFNASKPENDTQFLTAVTDPELPVLLNAIYAGAVAPIPTTNRTDLISVFLTGVGGLNNPPGVVASEQLRLNVNVTPTDSPNRLGVIAGDVAGFPNGRRLSDDVTDIALRVVAGVLIDAAFANHAVNGQLGDGVDANDVNFQSSFPYLAPPHEGFANSHGSEFMMTTGGIQGNNNLNKPQSFRLKQNFPNPFNPSTEIHFQVKNSEKVTLKVFDLLGREVRTLVDHVVESGSHAIHWDGHDNNGNAVVTGTYFYRLETPTINEARKMVLLK